MLQVFSLQQLNLHFISRLQSAFSRIPQIWTLKLKLRFSSSIINHALFLKDNNSQSSQFKPHAVCCSSLTPYVQRPRDPPQVLTNNTLHPQVINPVRIRFQSNRPPRSRRYQNWTPVPSPVIRSLSKPETFDSSLMCDMPVFRMAINNFPTSPDR